VARFLATLPPEFASWDSLAKDQYLEVRTLLSGYLLSSQGDRMLMGNSVEGRFPFLDREVMALANSFPSSYKLKVLDEKHVLKRVAKGLVTEEILRRPKQPYRAPDALSFIGADRPGWVDEMLSESALKASGLFDALMGVFARSVQRALGPAPVSVSARPDAEMAQRLPLRILLAEDYVVNQKLALRLLAQMGYRADVAANGLETIQALERQPYDVVLMDVQMPEMDGLEATRQIRSRWPAAEQPRIIAMTANAMQGDREICLEAGMDDYVSKPIRVDELVQALSRCQPLLPNRAAVDTSAASLAKTEEEAHAGI